MIIVRLLSRGPWLVGTTKAYSGIGADIVMESISLIDGGRYASSRPHVGGLEHIGGESFLGGSIRRIFADAMSSEPIPDAKALGFSAMAYVAILVGIALALLKAFVWSKGVFT